MLITVLSPVYASIGICTAVPTFLTVYVKFLLIYSSFSIFYSSGGFL